jgi:hypothetical protein
VKYRILPKLSWRALPGVQIDAPAKPAKPRRIEFRGHVKENSAEFHFGQKVIEVQGRPQMTIANGDGSPAIEFEIAPGNPVFQLPHGSPCKGMSSTRPPIDGRGTAEETAATPPVHGRGSTEEEGTRPPMDGRGPAANPQETLLTFAIQLFDGSVTGLASAKPPWTPAELKQERSYGSCERLAMFMRARGATNVEFHPRVFKNSRANGTNPRALAGAMPASVRTAHVGTGPSAEGGVNPAALERARRREEELSAK